MLSTRWVAIAAFLPSVAACHRPLSAAVAPGQISAAVATVLAAGADATPHPAMLRYPDISRSSIVFSYGDDLWVVGRGGGLASPLASPPGPETFPKFSPDGRTIGFVGNYEGNRDLYTIPTSGGVPKRVTYNPGRETLCDWTPDGRLLYFSSAFAGLGRQVQLLTVPSSGGLPTKLPPPYGANGSISADGKWLAYTPHTRDHRTWKRYRGGMATDIWLFNLEDHSARKVTDWEGTDSQPMWHGDRVYFLSDAGSAHRLNIWWLDAQSGRREQVTKFTDYDVKWPSIGPDDGGPGEVVFQNGAHLFVLNLETGESTGVEITIPGDRPTIRPHDVDVSEFIHARNLSATGKRALFEARGDIWTIPAKNGTPRNLTRTSGSAERMPSWSPDGQWIAYLCDQTGEYELYMMQSDGKGETRRLTRDGNLYRFNPTWSPDSKRITFTDKSGAIYLHTIDSGETTLIDTEPWASPMSVSWSSDSNWIAYTKSGDNRVSAIWLFNVQENQAHQVTAGMFNDTWPTFDRKGEYLYFATNREFSSPMYGDVSQSFIYANTDLLMAVPLRDEVGSPWAPKSDEETWGDDEDEDDDTDGDENEDEDSDDDDEDDADAKSDKEGGDKKDKKKKDDEIKPVEIEIEGFERRALKVPVKRGNFSNLSVTHDGKLIYVRGSSRGSDSKPTIMIFDPTDEEKEEKTVISDARGYRISADGKKLLVRQESKTAIVDAKEDQNLDKPLSLSGMTSRVDPRAEWRQIFQDAWRIHRDYFYDPNMHGVDWNAMRERYGAMLDDCVSRRDVTYVIGEMISELNVGHAYVRGQGDIEKEPEVGVGMLGADFALENGAYRIIRIHEGAAWDVDARGPLSEPGVDVNEGDYLLAVNGVPLDTAKDPWAAFQGLADKVVTLTVSAKPASDDDAREVVIKTLKSERNLRYRFWIEHNRKYVEDSTGGRVGYIYVPNTGIKGQNDLVRQFFGQLDKEALIIDERWNGGGQIPTRFIELLNRPATNYWARRHGNDWSWPPDAHQGPKCMLINGLAGSGGDAFPAYFKQAGLGKLIGMRTWGGLVGLSGNPRFVDGGSTSAPTFAYYETDGTWGIEGHGVDPDIEVIDDPALMVDGGDPQLDRAIAHMLEELKRNPYVKPKRPAYPDRSGMGVSEQDK